MSDPGSTEVLLRLREEFRHETRCGDRQKAYLLSQNIVRLAEADISDFFSTGRWALKLTLFSDAIEMLSKVISLSVESGNNYYLDQAYFWRAYSFYKLSRHSLALSDLRAIKDTESPFFVPVFVASTEPSGYLVSELLNVVEAAAS
jgi:tetratricopeptide (TPR) repeat protein